MVSIVDNRGQYQEFKWATGFKTDDGPWVALVNVNQEVMALVSAYNVITVEVK